MSSEHQHERKRKLLGNWRQFLTYREIKGKPRFMFTTEKYKPIDFSRTDSIRAELWKKHIKNDFTSLNPVEVITVQLDAGTRSVLAAGEYDKKMMAESLYSTWMDAFGKQSLNLDNNYYYRDNPPAGYFITSYRRHESRSLAIKDQDWGGVSLNLIPLQTALGATTTAVLGLRTLAERLTYLYFAAQYLPLVLESSVSGLGYHSVYLNSLNVRQMGVADVNALWNKVKETQYCDIIKIALEFTALGISLEGLELFDYDQGRLRPAKDFQLGLEGAEDSALIEKQYGYDGQRLGKLLGLTAETDANPCLGLSRRNRFNQLVKVFFEQWEIHEAARLRPMVVGSRTPEEWETQVVKAESTERRFSDLAAPITTYRHTLPDLRDIQVIDLDVPNPVKPSKQVIAQNNDGGSKSDTAEDSMEFLNSEYNGQCQVCGTEHRLSNGHKWIKTFHIFPVGQDTWWGNRPFNILGLCPNCHDLAKYGGGLDLNNLFSMAKELVEGLALPEEVFKYPGVFYSVPITLDGANRRLVISKRHLNQFAELIEASAKGGATTTDDHEKPVHDTAIETEEVNPEQSVLNASEVDQFTDKIYALINEAQYDQAQNLLDTALALCPTSSACYVGRAYIYDVRQEEKNALEWYNKALSYNPNELIALNNASIILQEKGSYQEALTYCNRLINLDPDNSSVHYLKGTILQDLYQYEEAVNGYKHSIMLDQDNTDAYFRLGMLLEEQFLDHKRALEMFDKVIELNPETTWDAHFSKQKAKKMPLID